MIRAVQAAAAAVTLLAGITTMASAQTAGSMTQQGADTWRASKLPGVAIYGPDSKKVGDITDVLVDHAGKATAVVIGVGGFLGIGEKDVAVPFDQVKFSDKPMSQPAGAPAAPGGVATTTSNGAQTPATTALGMPVDTAGDPKAPAPVNTAPGENSAPGAGNTNPAAQTVSPPMQETPSLGTPVAAVAPPAAMTPALTPSTAYPDHGTIAMTADQLKAAPGFTFVK